MLAFFQQVRIELRPVIDCGQPWMHEVRCFARDVSDTAEGGINTGLIRSLSLQFLLSHLQVVTINADQRVEWRWPTLSDELLAPRARPVRCTLAAPGTWSSSTMFHVILPNGAVGRSADRQR